jgi:LysM repeat protein
MSSILMWAQQSMRLALALSAGVIGACCLPRDAEAQQTDLPALVSRVRPFVVTIVGYDEEGDTVGTGTGFIANGRVVTALHVLEDAVYAEILFGPKRMELAARVVSADARSDVMVIGTRNRLDSGLPIRGTRVEPGERVVLIGSPFGLDATVSEGVASGYRPASTVISDHDHDDGREEISGPVLVVAGGAWPGSSGGPAVDGSGAVVGFVRAGIAEGLIYLIPSERFAATTGSASIMGFAEWAGLFVRHTVGPGESIAAIVARFGLTPERIARANCIEATEPIPTGVKQLFIPLRTHIVGLGDTPSDIAMDHGMTLGAFLELNALTRTSIIKVGQRLLVDERDWVVHCVRSGESLASLARRYKTTVGALRKRNHLPGALRAGNILVARIGAKEE